MVERTEKRFDFAATNKVSEGVAFASVIGFVATEPRVTATQKGDKVVELRIPLSNTGKKITGAFGAERADETLWLSAVAFDGEHNKLATRLEKIARKGLRLELIGTIKQDEYNGKINYSMTIRDFSILWSKEKGITVGGEYSFVNALKAEKEGAAFVGLEAFVAKEPEVKTVNGRSLLTFSVALNKVGTKLNYPLGIDGKAEDVQWVQVNLWDTENFKQVDNAKKVLRKGAAFFGQGYMTTSQSEDRTFYNLNLNSFEIVRGAKNDENATQHEAPATSGTYTPPAVENDDFDDDLPF